MRMSKPVKILLGISTAFLILWPFIVAAIFMLLALIVPAFAMSAEPSPQNYEAFGLMVIIGWFFFAFFAMFMSLLQLALQALYVVLILKDKTLEDTPRILYTLGTFFLFYIAMPVYFVLRVWKGGEET